MRRWAGLTGRPLVLAGAPAAAAAALALAGLAWTPAFGLALMAGAAALAMALPATRRWRRDRRARRVAARRLQRAVAAVESMAAARVPVSPEVWQDAVRRAEAALGECARLGATVPGRSGARPG